jgi:biotin carboxyl carrier protein
MKYVVTLGEQSIELHVERRPDGTYGVRGPTGTEIDVRSVSGVRTPGLVSLLVDGQTIVVQPVEGEARFRGQRFAVRAESWRDRVATRAVANEAGQARKILASMPGRVVRVLCEPGTAVAQGAPLVVIEAMKMQNELCAKTDGVVRAVHVSAGQTVDRGALLVELE